MENKKSNKFLIILMFSIGILAVVAVIIYSQNKSTEKDRAFVSSKRSRGIKIYDEIKSIDFEKSYPKDVNELILLNNNIQELFYGNILVDDSLLEELLTVQRKIYSDKILDKNSFEEQYNILLESLNNIKETNVSTISLEIKDIVYDKFNENLCVVTVLQHASDMKTITWSYFLERNEEFEWKIYSWDKI